MCRSQCEYKVVSVTCVISVMFFPDVVQKAPDQLAVVTPPDVPTDKRIEIEAASQMGEWQGLGRKMTTDTKWSVSFFNHVCKRQDLAAVARSPKVPESLRQSGHDRLYLLPLDPFIFLLQVSTVKTVWPHRLWLTQSVKIQSPMMHLWALCCAAAGCREVNVLVLTHLLGPEICLRINTSKQVEAFCIFPELYTSSLTRPSEHAVLTTISALFYMCTGWCSKSL